jgi:hypothetical protein
MGARRTPSRATSASERKADAPHAGRRFPAEAFDDHDDVSPKVVQAIQDRADKILKNGKWVVVDGYAGKK